MKIVFLDQKTIGDDIDLSYFQNLGTVVTYGFSSPEEVPDRVRDADVIVVNKVKINEVSIGSALNLKLVCVTSTGVDILDLPYLEKRGIPFRNVCSYSTNSVAQHTFALLFYLLEKMRYYDDYVKNGTYINDKMFTHFGEHFHEIADKTWGIIGLGAIGRKVADIAKMFGAKVIYCSPSSAPPQDGYKQVDFLTLLSDSDIISVHAPLNSYTKGLLDKNAFSKMKKNAIFLNLGRGAIVVEEALANALLSNQIAAAGLDVLCEEPMNPLNPLAAIKDSKKLLITPHIAWASVESRTRLMKLVYENIANYFMP